MTEDNTKDFLSSKMNIWKMHLAVPKHDVLVIILKNEDHRNANIGANKHDVCIK